MGEGWNRPSRQDIGPASETLLRDTRKRLDRAKRLHREGNAEAAINILEDLVAQCPDYMGALQTLGLLHAEKGNYPRALMCLLSAAMLNPSNWLTLTALSRVYLRLGAHEMAVQTLERATKLKGDDASIFVTLGAIYGEDREYELAADAYRKALAIDPSLKPALLGLAKTCFRLGRYEEAAEIYKRLVDQGDRSIAVLRGLARLPAVLVKLDLMSLLNNVCKDRRDDEAEFDTNLAFARALILDRAGRHEEAWEHLIGANRAVYLQIRESVERVSDRQKESLARLRAKSWNPRGGNPGTGKNAISLFILGPSRSGKTTMEKLVGALPGVKRGYENLIAEHAARRAFHNTGFLDLGCFRLLPAEIESVCRSLYEADLERRAGFARVLTNTGPGYIHDAARMASVLPNLRFIFIKRDPDDLALRIFQTRYPVGNYYAYDMRTIREHIAWYYDMIDGLAAMFPSIARVIHYEDMVADPPRALAEAAALCGLDMPDGPLPPIGDDRGCAAPYRDLMAAQQG